MLRDIAGIRLCGANFDEVTNILLLDPHEGNKVKPVKGTLLYGRNGAGKSTLAKAVRKAKGESQDTISQAEFLSINNLPIELTEEEKSHVFVFDEEYIDKNVKFHESGLDTIIMLGHQVEIAEQLQEAQKNLEKAKGEFDIQEKTIIENEKIECKNSPKYHIKKMRLALQGDAAISTKVPIFNKKYDETNILKLLRTKIERPELSERECYLLELAQTGRSSQLNDMIDIFSNTETYICPTCLQPVSEKYKQDLVQSVQKVLSKTVEEHLAELRTVMAEEIEIDFSPFSKLEMSTNSCLEILAQINMGIRNNNLLIQSKIDNPYSICNGEIISVSNLLTQLNKALENLENERLEYNKKITDTKPIIKRLTEINNLIAYLDIRELYIQYLACKAQLKKEHEKLEERRATCTNLTKLVDELEAKQKNVRVALSIINRNLSYIFFSNDRFKIDYRNNNYVLLSNGKPVQPSKISQGERNIIGLCYFFASILENQEETTAYTKEYLLLIDDPVSSFDMENKTGIMSFLRYQLGKFLLGNEYTKSIIMTHDLLTYYDSEKMFGELIEASKVKYGGDKPVYKRYELKNKILIPFPHNGRQEYTELMKIVYRFALGDADEYELVIGNIMRQVLEAFSTFQYKKGIEEVSTDRSILAILPEKEYQSYFENLMYRLILNNGSHRLDQTRSMSDMNFFTVISDSEKKRTAKEILCFIYLLNEKHVLAHLDGCSNVQSNLSKWCNDVKNKVGA